MDQALAVAINNQLNYERYSAAVYDALAAALDLRNLVGMAGYLYKRGREEDSHYRKFLEFLVDVNEKPVIDALQKPDTDSLPLELGLIGEAAFQAALNHEKTVTARIQGLLELARQIQDPAAMEFVRPFVLEQVEEEKTLEEILTKFTLAHGDGAAILLIDHDLKE